MDAPVPFQLKPVVSGTEGTVGTVGTMIPIETSPGFVNVFSRVKIPIPDPSPNTTNVPPHSKSLSAMISYLIS